MMLNTSRLSDAHLYSTAQTKRGFNESVPFRGGSLDNRLDLDKMNLRDLLGSTGDFKQKGFAMLN